MTINCRGTLLSLDTPLLMGILNITPDSFFDGGKYTSIDLALAQAEKMSSEGATFIDIGPSSSKPGSAISDPEVEIKLIQPVLQQLLHSFPNTYFSIDTYHSKVAERALDLGASMINDISGGQWDKNLLATVARYDVPYVMMHIQGQPKTMQLSPNYSDVVTEIAAYFAQQIEKAEAAGIHDLILDPGFGFGKTVAHNFELLQQLDYFKTLKHPILVGLSRKSMIYKTLESAPEDALNGTTALHAWALERGANILRVHNVKEAKECIRLWQALQ